MRVKQQRIAKFLFHPRQFGLKGLMIRLPDLRQILLTLGGGRFHAGFKGRASVEQGIGEQPGGGRGIKRCVVRRAVEVNHKAGIFTHQNAGTECARKIVQAGNMPVGIRQRQRRVRQTTGDFRRQVRACVRNADQQRRSSPDKMERIGDNVTS